MKAKAGYHMAVIGYIIIIIILLFISTLQAVNKTLDNMRQYTTRPETSADWLDLLQRLSKTSTFCDA